MKNKKPFTDVSNIISKDNLRPQLQFAIVDKGFLVATNTHILSVINLADYIEEEELKNLEGKSFDAALIKKLCTAEKLTFEKDNIKFENKKEKCVLSYSENEYFYQYPNWRSVVPGYKNETFNFSDFKPSFFCLNSKYIAAAANALNSENVVFFSSDKNRPNLIFGTKEVIKNGKMTIETNFNSFVLVMPIVLELENQQKNEKTEKKPEIENFKKPEIKKPIKKKKFSKNFRMRRKINLTN